MTTTLKVAGMNCGACASHATKALQSVAGVQAATVDLGSGSATVQHNESIAPETLVAAVVAEGHQAQSE